MDCLLPAQAVRAAKTDLRAGIIAALIFNVNRGKNQSALTPGDFFPSTKAPRKRQTTKEMMELAKLFCQAVGGKIIEKKKS